MNKTLVGNCPIGEDPKHYLFEQKCDCDCFPCDCYNQDKDGKWKYKDGSDARR